jgi:hypothetical protein
MARCACKVGFFTLRDCANEGQQSCGVCGRNVCTDHVAPRVDAVVCVECAARQEEQEATAGRASTPVEQELVDPAQARTGRYRLRHRYYSTGYDPPFWGSWYDTTYYSDYDMRHVGDDDAYEGGFGDS